MAFEVPNYQQYYQNAYNRLNEYYTRILAEEQGDVERAKRRLTEDYEKGNRIISEDYTRSYNAGRENYGAQQQELGVDVLSDQQKYEQALMQQGMENEAETGALQGDLMRRGVSEGGLAQFQSGKLGEKQAFRRNVLQTDYTNQKTRQQLRREAIDRALRKSEEDLKYGKERGLEDETIKQKRGTEDLASQFAKYLSEKNQERQDKALQLGDSEYNREFQARSTQEGFRLQNESLSKV